MNIVILIVMLIGSLVLGASPLTSVQLLWLNIIMDTLGVLALSTEISSSNILIK